MRILTLILIWNSAVATAQEQVQLKTTVFPKVTLFSAHWDSPPVIEENFASVIVGVEYALPKINPAEFEIVDAYSEFLPSVYGDVWRLWPSETNSWHVELEYDYGLKGDPNHLGSEVLSQQGYGIGGGGGKFSFVKLTPDHVGGVSRFYSPDNDPLVVRLRMVGGLTSGVQESSGVFLWMYFGPLRTTYTVRKLNPEANPPPTVIGSAAASDYLALKYDPIFPRPHPMIFEEARSHPAYLTSQLSATWDFPKAKQVTCSLFGFPGYRYTLYRGTSIGTGDPVQSTDGSGTVLTLGHDDTASDDSKAFFWVAEEKAPD